MYWYRCMCQNVFQTICSQLKKIQKLCSLLPGAGAVPKQAGFETLVRDLQSMTELGIFQVHPLIIADSLTQLCIYFLLFFFFNVYPDTALQNFVENYAMKRLLPSFNIYKMFIKNSMNKNIRLLKRKKTSFRIQEGK